MAVLDQDGPVLGQLRTGGHRRAEGRGPIDGSRPDRAGHHAGRPPEEDHEQHPGDAGAVLGQPVRGLSRLTGARARRPSVHPREQVPSTTPRVQPVVVTATFLVPKVLYDI